MELTDLGWGAITAGASAISGFIASRLERKKQSKEIDMLEVTNLEKGFTVYQGLLNDLDLRFKTIIAEMRDAQTHEVAELNRRLDGHGKLVQQMTEAHRDCETKYDKVLAYIKKKGLDIAELF